MWTLAVAQTGLVAPQRGAGLTISKLSAPSLGDQVKHLRREVQPPHLISEDRPPGQHPTGRADEVDRAVGLELLDERIRGRHLLAGVTEGHKAGRRSGSVSLAIRKKASVSIASQPTIATTAQDRLPAYRHLLPREADADVFVPPDRTVKRFENSGLGRNGLDVVAVWRAVVGGRDRKGGTRAGRDLPVRPPKILRNGVAPSTCSPMWTSPPRVWLLRDIREVFDPGVVRPEGGMRSAS